MNAWFAAGATAVVMSERGRSLLRRGLVYGLASAMNAGETFTSAATGVAHGAESVASSAGDLAGDLVGEAKQTRRGEEGTNSGSGSHAERSAPKKSKAAGASA